MADLTFTAFPPLGPATTQGAIDPQGWDRCELAGQVLPGLVHFEHGDIKLKEDPKKKAGANGANPTYHGLDPQPMGISIKTYSDADRERLAEILVPLLPVDGKVPKPVSFDHPSTRLLGMSNVVITGAGPLKPVPGSPGIAVMTVFLKHWLPVSEKKATTTPKVALHKLKSERKGALANPAPPAQPGFGGPPKGLKVAP